MRCCCRPARPAAASAAESASPGPYAVTTARWSLHSTVASLARAERAAEALLALLEATASFEGLQVGASAVFATEWPQVARLLSTLITRWLPESAAALPKWIEESAAPSRFDATPPAAL